MVDIDPCVTLVWRRRSEIFFDFHMGDGNTCDNRLSFLPGKRAAQYKEDLMPKSERRAACQLLLSFQFLGGRPSSKRRRRVCDLTNSISGMCGTCPIKIDKYTTNWTNLTLLSPAEKLQRNQFIHARSFIAPHSVCRTLIKNEKCFVLKHAF